MKKQATIGVVGLSGQSAFLKVSRFNKPGETVTAESLYMEPGGKGFNQAVAAQRLGASVKYLTCLSNDAFGMQCLKQLEKEKITPLVVWSDQPSAFATILTDDAGENQVTVYCGASATLSAGDVERLLDAFRVCDMVLLQLEYPVEVIQAVIRLADNYHIPTILNPAPACLISIPFLRKFSWLLPNRREATTLLGLSENASLEEIINGFYSENLCHVIITLGGDGALLINENKVLHYPALPVQVVDTTGAGDTFCAAFAVCLSEGMALEEAIHFAMRAASYSIQHRHVLMGLPFRHQVDHQPTEKY